MAKIINIVVLLMGVVIAVSLCVAMVPQVAADEAMGEVPDLDRDELIELLSKSPKLGDPESMLQELTDEGSTTRVIVSLQKPAGSKLVDFNDMNDRDQMAELVRETRERIIASLEPAEVRITNVYNYLFGFSAEVTLQGLRDLTYSSDVASIVKDKILHAHTAQGIPLMNAATVRSTYSGAGMSIAICDTGIDYTHPRLGGGSFPNSKVIGGWDCGDDDANPMDCQGHGTCCAGIAAGDLGTVGDYIGGVAYSARLYALKIASGCTDSASDSDMIEAWDWCVAHRNDDPANPIRVISTSFGGGYHTSLCNTESPLMTTAAANAVAAGITLFCSSGNEGYCDGTGWPACISHVNAVGAVYDANIGRNPPSGYVGCISPDSCYPWSGGNPGDPCYPGVWYVDYTTAPDQVTTYSNSASFVSVLAPSENAYTTDIVGSGGYSTGDYDTTFGGTSAACPYAAGAAACLQSAADDITGSYLTPAEVKSYLTSTGDSVTDPKVAITKPRINLGNAVDALPSPANPDIYVTPPSLGTTLDEGTTGQLPLNIANVGDDPLEVYDICDEETGTPSVAVAPNNNPSGNPDEEPVAGEPVYLVSEVENAVADDNQPAPDRPVIEEGSPVPGGDEGDASKDEAATPVPIWERLQGLDQAEKQNASLQLEVSTDLDAATTDEVRNAESLWNGGAFAEAIEAIQALEADGVAIAVGISWKAPKAEGYKWWSSDVRISTRQYVTEQHLDFDAQTGNLFAVLQYYDPVYGDHYWSIQISTNGGHTWQETYQWWAGYEIRDTSAAVVDDYLFVGYVAWDGGGLPQEGRMRRAFVSNGAVDNSYGYVTVFDKGVDINEIALCTNADEWDNRVYYWAILANNMLVYFWDDPDAVSWTEESTGVTDAWQGLDVTWNEGYPSGYFLYASYISSKKLNPVVVLRHSSPYVWEAIEVRYMYTGMGFYPSTSVSAYDDTVICMYEHEYTNGNGLRYNISYDAGDTWSYGEHFQPDVGHDFYNPDVTARGGAGTACVYDDEGGAFDPVWYEFRAGYGPGLWNAPEQINEMDAATMWPNRIDYLPPLPGNTYAYGTIYISYDPDPGTAYFDRIDYGACECINDASWMWVSPTSGTVNPAGDMDVTVYFDATGLTAGTYEGNVKIDSNDPDEGCTVVPVTLTVTPSPTPTPTPTPGPTLTPTPTPTPAPTVTPTPGTSVTIECASAPAGETADVDITITTSDPDGIGSATITLTVDTAVVTVGTIAAGDLGTVYSNTVGSTTTMSAATGSSPGPTGTLTFATVTLNAVGSSGECCDLDIEVSSMYDGTAGNPQLIYPSPVTDCSFCIGTPRLEGDVHPLGAGNGAIDSADFQLVAQGLVGTITLTGNDFLAADVNDSVTLDSADLQLVAQYLVGTITAFPGGMYIP